MSGVGTINPAYLTAGALIGTTNGDFTTPTTWNTAGATNIINGTATLTEQSQKLSELTQAFIIPTGDAGGGVGFRGSTQPTIP